MAEKKKKSSARSLMKDEAEVKAGKEKTVEASDTKVPDQGPSPAQPRGSGAKRRSSRPLSLAITLNALKILCIWVPLSLLFLLVLVLLTAQLYLTPQRVENLVVAGFRSASHGDISLRVRRFNPYRGFVIENLEIRNGKAFGGTKFLEIERLVLDYRFFPLLIGNVYFNEIGIYKPRIYLEQKKGVWNAAVLMKEPEKPTEKKKEKKEEKKPVPKASSKEINLPVSVTVKFKFVLEDLRVYARSVAFTSSMEGLSAGMEIYIPPFKRIPKSLEAVSILERMKIVLNPREEMDVSFVSKEIGVQPPLVLTWKLLYERKKEGPSVFTSLFKFGTYKTPVRFKRTHLAPLHFMLSYDLYYDPSADRLSVNHFGLRFLGRKWLFLTGTVDRVTTTQNVDLRMTESTIMLDDLYPYYRALTADRNTVFGGALSLCPLYIKGTPANMDIRGEVNLRNLNFKNPAAQAAVPRLQAAYTVLKRGDSMKVTSRIKAPVFTYALGRNRSGDNGIDIGLDLNALDGFTRVKLDGLTMRYYNPASGKNALFVSMTGDVGLKPGTAGTLRMETLRFEKGPMLDMLPRNIRKTLASVPLNRPVDMTIDLTFGMGKDFVRAGLGMLVKVPDFDISDLTVRADMVQDNRKKRVTLNNVSVGSRSRNLLASIRGAVDMKTPPLSDSNLKVSVKLDSPQMNPVYGAWNVAGLVELSAAMKGDLKNGKAFGSVRIKDFSVKNVPAKMYVDGVNMNFPFEYYFTPRYRGETRLVVDKTSVIENEFFRAGENFSISSIRVKHPSRDRLVEYLKDFSASMSFRNNTFEIVTLKATVLDGTLYGRDIFFNLADMKTRNMEFRLVMDVTNVDVGVLDDPDRAKKIRDAELSLNANFSGRGVDIRRELNMQGYVNIYKIGDKFANRLMTGLSEEKGKSKLGAIGQFAMDNSMNVKGFNFNLDKGLVYTTVTLSRRVIGYLFGVKDEKVEFERMPIQEYLRKVREVE